MTMTAPLPTRYSARDDSTFFEVGGTLVSVRYSVEERKRWGLIPEPYLAQLEIIVDDGAARLQDRYDLPTDLKTGPELAPIERNLYALIDEAIRTIVQLRAQESTERAARAAESELLRESPSGSAGSGALRHAPADSLLDELSEKLVTAVRHVTKVTSLTADGLAEYQRQQAESYERILQSTSPEAAAHLHGVLRSVAGFLEHEIEEERDIRRLKDRAQEYLLLLEQRERSSGLTLNPIQRRTIVEDFVPAYARLLREYRKAGRVPTNMVEHTFGSFFGGGISGWLAIDLFGESLIESLAGLPLDLPGWWIGAGVAFFWPYLKVFHGLLTREARLERKRSGLLKRMDQRLDRAALPSVK